MPRFYSHDIYEAERRHGRSSDSRRKAAGKHMLSRAAAFASRCARATANYFSGARSGKNLTEKILRSMLILGGGLALLIGLWLAFIYFTLPDVDKVGALFAAESTVITDRNGVELYRIHGDEDRTFVPLNQITDFVKQATIAIEDERFYERGCFDPRAFTRAVIGNIIGGFGSQGGSTITQQFAKNALIGSRRKRITRKLKEYMLSCKLEKRYPKDEILELYLNRIPYGQSAHGVEQASKIYFAKSASGLTLAESSILAALPQLPSYLSPYGRHVRTTLSERGKERMMKGKIRSIGDIRDDDFWIGLVGETFDLQTAKPADPSDGTGKTLYIGGRTDQVLKNMENQKFITGDDRLNALKELQTIEFKRARENIRAPHFVLWVREEIKDRFADQIDEKFLERGGLTVVTTLDYELQEIAEAVIGEVGELNIDLYGAYNAALLAVGRRTGQILAYVGNRDYWDEETDGNVDVIRAPRQPGSSFKPFSYAAAFLNGFNPATVIYDVPTKIGDDEPENFDGRFFGPLTIRKALGASRNIPAAKSYFMAGREDSIVNLAADMGIPTVRDRREELSAARGERYQYGWPLSLGAAEIPLYEMVQGYSTFARGGEAVDLTAILRIEDRDGNILFSASDEPEERDVLDPRVAYMITSILSDESVRPEGYWREQLSIPGYQTAAKTGTSNKCLEREAPKNDNANGRCTKSKPDNTWTIGYTPRLIAGAWAGNASGGTLYSKASGLDTASPIWRRFMIAAHKSIESREEDSRISGATGLQSAFQIPEGLESAQISELSGKLASECTPAKYRRAEIFFEGDVPKELDDACVETEVDKLTGLLASEECPKEARKRGNFFVPKSVLPVRWNQWEKSVQNWARDVSSGTGSSYWITLKRKDGEKRIFRGTGAFLPLPLPLAPREKCTLDITPGRMVKPLVRLLFPVSGGIAGAPLFRPKIEYTVGDSIREIRYELDGRVVAVAGSGSDLRFVSQRAADEGGNTASGPPIRVPRRFETSGIHSLKVTLVDSYYNEAVDSVRFRFEKDRSPPRVTVTYPANGARMRINENVTVRAEAKDFGGAIDRVQFFLGDQLITTKRKASGRAYEASFTVKGAPGETTLKVVAQDLAKNKGEDEIFVELIK